MWQDLGLYCGDVPRGGFRLRTVYVAMGFARWKDGCVSEWGVIVCDLSWSSVDRCDVYLFPGRVISWRSLTPYDLCLSAAHCLSLVLKTWFSL